MSTKARTLFLQAKEISEKRLRINTICNFQTLKSAVDIEIIEIPNIMSRVYSESFSRR